MKKLAFLAFATIVVMLAVSCNKDEEEPINAKVETRIGNLTIAGDVNTDGIKVINDSLTKKFVKFDNFQNMEEAEVNKNVANFWALVKSIYSESELSALLFKNLKQGGKEITLTAPIQLLKDGAIIDTWTIQLSVKDDFVLKLFKMKADVQTTGLTADGIYEIMYYHNDVICKNYEMGNTDLVKLQEDANNIFSLHLKAWNLFDVKSMLIDGMAENAIEATCKVKFSLLCDEKEIGSQEFTTVVNAEEKTAAFKSEVKLVFTNVDANGQNSVKGYVAFLNKDIIVPYTEKPVLKSTGSLTEAQALAKNQFAQLIAQIDTVELANRLKAGIDASSTAEMKAENINVNGNVKVIVTLTEVSTNAQWEKQYFSTTGSKKRNSFVYTTDFGNATKVPTEMNAEIVAMNDAMVAFKTANGLTGASITMHWKNLQVESGHNDIDRESFRIFLENSNNVVTFANVKLTYSLPLQSYEKVQILFNNGLRPNYWSPKSGNIISVKQLLENRNIDNNFEIYIDPDIANNMSWTFDGISNINPQLITTLRAINTGSALKVHSSSPIIEADGDFSEIGLQGIKYWEDPNFYATHFKDSDNDVVLGTIPVLSATKRGYFARWFALKGVKHLDDTSTAY